MKTESKFLLKNVIRKAILATSKITEPEEIITVEYGVVSKMLQVK